MSNVFLIAWRAPCLRTRSAQRFPLSSLVRLLSPGARNGQDQCGCRVNIRDTFQRGLRTCTRQNSQQWSTRISSRSFGTSSGHFKRSNRDGYIKPPKAKGLRTFSAKEIPEIFGTSSVSTKLGNTALRVLQQRRIEGTLDLDMPVDIQKNVPEGVLNRGLEWLRMNYPMDEDAAIMKRIEREEQEDEDKLTRRAEELGLYKPQSGHFGKEKDKDGGVHGVSIFQRMRERNEKLNEEQMERERKEWLEGEAKDKANAQKQLAQATNLQKYNPNSVVESQPRADPKTRPFLAWVQKHHLRATNTDYEAADKLTTARRLLPALAVTILTIGGCYLYAEQYDPPPHEYRRWKDTPRSASTALGIIGLNAAIFVLWKFPPAWLMLNRYFTVAPVYPYALSLLGSVFSHQSLRHIAMNMLFVWFVGTKLHEDVGRGDFLALYLGTGVFASMVSLTSTVLRNQLHIYAFGASGAVSGIVAAWCMVHANDKFTIMFLPKSWQEMFSTSGRNFLAVIVALELTFALTPLSRITRVMAGRQVMVDHVNHLGGFASGALVGWYWKQLRDKEEKKRKGTWRRYLGRN